MDGRWQIGAKTATEYGRIAAETAKLMKWVDASIELAACGSSGPGMASFAAWEEEVLRHTLPHVDYIALHTYFDKRATDTAGFLASVDAMDRFIKEVVAICDSVAAQLHSERRIMICFDEWNVWYRTRDSIRRDKLAWSSAPFLIEEVYNMEDALVVGGALITLLNNANRVRVACLAQLVNVIAPIMAESGGPAWRQTIFYPFAQAARFGKGQVLQSVVRSPTYTTEQVAQVPYLLLAAVLDPIKHELTLFAINRSLTEPLLMDVELRAFPKLAVTSAIELRHDDLQAVNSKEWPDCVLPVETAGATYCDDHLRATLKPASWNLIRLAAGDSTSNVNRRQRAAG
jgi:alpha-N-arabinofuranosidase